jgi:hypothetical protein
MSKSNAFENALMLLLLNNDAIANIGDAGGLRQSVADGSLYIALHTADPGEGGVQTTSEAAYTGYARVGVTRDTAGFTVSGNTGTNAADITFPQASGGSATVTHWSIGTLSSGGGMILYSGALSPTPTITNGIRPVIPAGDMQITED